MDSFIRKLQKNCKGLYLKFACLCRSILSIILFFFRFLLTILNPFFIHLIYFLALATVGLLFLRKSKPKKGLLSKPKTLDLFFSCVSAVTVTGLSTVELEIFSNEQLLFLTILMFGGGEVFTNMVELHLGRFKLRRLRKKQNRIGTASFETSPSNSPNQIELGIVENVDSLNSVPGVEFASQVNSVDTEHLRYKSLKFLSFVLLGYLLLINIVGISLVSVYFSLVSSAKNVLKAKGLKLFTFSLFTSVSTFANCGFIPTNENMMAFQKNPGLLWILIPQILLGNTLFPPFLRLSVWVVGKFVKRNESNFLLKNSEKIGFPHFLSSFRTWLLVVTVVGFLLVQFVLFCSMEWSSIALSGMTSYEKIVGILFQIMNTRHSGENLVDLSTLAQAVLVLFVVIMYLPPYTSYVPLKDLDDEKYPQECERKRTRREKVLDNFLFSQLSYIVIFVVLICITERKQMNEDPINFRVLNIVVEVVSAYGNVGYSTGYGCARQLKPDSSCQDKWYGFSGKWSDEGKLILIFVMIFGRLKRFNMDGGKAWKLP